MGLIISGKFFEVIMPYSVWYWQKTYVVSLGVSAAVGLQASGIFYYNIAAVFCLTMFSDQIETQINMRKIVRQLVTNPMLIGIFAGFCC